MTTSSTATENRTSSLADRNLAYRTRVVQMMLLGALVLRPLPASVVDRVAQLARAVCVDDGMLSVARDASSGSLEMVAVDFDRNGYTSDWSQERSQALHTSVAMESAWSATVDDAVLAGRWEALGALPPDTLGRQVWQFYRARGLEFPGRPGAAPPLLAQHDWVHVLADYGTRVESELEVFAFTARASDDLRGFSLLAMVVSLFETGYLEAGAGLVPKSEAALPAGSVGPWEPGGISEFQVRTGRAAAEAESRPYESYGASQ